MRLETGGRLIDRTRPLRFRFDDRWMTGLAGDTLASALIGQGRILMGRSFKYHRPRGPVAAGLEEPNALVTLGTGARAEPNVRATQTELFQGLRADSQNRWPSLAFDLMAANDLVSRFLPAGFYYKTFIRPRAAWKHLFEPAIRRAAGLGPAPKAADPDRYDQVYAFCDVLVAGGGVAGLAAALAAARTGARVMLFEQAPHWGGRAPVDGGTVAGGDPAGWVAAAVAELAAMPDVTLRTRATVAAVHDHGYVLVEERLTDHLGGGPGPRRRLWRIRAGRVVNACGAFERPLAFPGNDRPGVMLASALRDYVVNWAVAPGPAAVVVTNNDDAYRTALALRRAGISVPVIADARPAADGPLPQAARAAGIRVATGTGIAGTVGRGRVVAVQLCDAGGGGHVTETIPCDAVAMSGGWSPAVHLWSQPGGRLRWDEAGAMFVPDPDHPPTGAAGEPIVTCAGAAAGALRLPDCIASGARAGDPAAAAPPAEAEAEAPLLPVWVMPSGAGPRKRAKMWLDFQNDVKVSDVELAAREGYRSVEHTKRYTTLGMATDQGKLSNVNGLAVLAQALDEAIPRVGTTTFRPPFVPVTIGALAGEARGAVFQPLRRTPLHDWHAAHGAVWEPVGLWRRPYCYPRANESRADAVAREVLNTRRALGLLDASTLGKIVVKGPDAGRFLDMIYTGAMSSLPVGRCRYGLLCNEQGFLIDDGVVARLAEDTWLCHTTSGGADRIHVWMEDWLQTEWWNWRVFTLNLTEQLAQIAVVGPHARKALEALGGMDVSKAALPFMHWAEGTLAGIPARVFRISFSGELSYEVAVPADRGVELWERLVAAGGPLGVMPYGTEALHVMRAEKGFIMIGDETDGTVIPQDLGLGWAISARKPDYLGKRGQMRPALADPDRWRLVGLMTLDGSVIPEGAYAVGAGRNANGQTATEGRVTSTYFSPTLNRGIALGLIRRGPERMGEVLTFAAEGRRVQARIVSPVFHDPEGKAQDV